MTDRDSRLLAANGRVAGLELAGDVEAERYVAGETAYASRPVVDILKAPSGARLRQAVLGEAVRVLDTHEGWSFVQRAADGYIGYVEAEALAAGATPTHRVVTPATHVYPRPDIKRGNPQWLSFGSALRVVSAIDDFFEIEPLRSEGPRYVYKEHLRPLNKPLPDPVSVAQRFFGVPYLWGGNSAAGIDCSGLVQAGMLATGRDCPGDSDQQAEALGQTRPTAATPSRGDLYFWPGHVAWAVDEDTLIHANAFHMAVAYEPIAEAVARIGTPSVIKRMVSPLNG